jgi:membrane-bound lytic murein transglycosylase B
MMQVESGGKNYDLNGNLIGSSAGAMGLFQFMPASVTGLYFDRSDPIL